jgi:hypothetical protein
MDSPRNTSRLLVLLGALAALACACKGRSGAEPAAVASATTPALWEPVDKQFTGCEGG